MKKSKITAKNVNIEFFNNGIVLNGHKYIGKSFKFKGKCFEVDGMAHEIKNGNIEGRYESSIGDEIERNILIGAIIKSVFLFSILFVLLIFLPKLFNNLSNTENLIFLVI